jgi:hypothetical protein
MSAAVPSSSSVAATYPAGKVQSTSGKTTQLPKSDAPAQSPEEKFLAYAKMSPAEKLRAALLSQLGLTEEKVKAMSPEDQQKVEEKIRDLIKQAAEKQMEKTGQGGFVTDIEV